MSVTYKEGQLVEIEYKYKWLKATIEHLHHDDGMITVKYLEKLPGLQVSDNYILKKDINSKIRVPAVVDLSKPYGPPIKASSAKLVTSNFKKGQVVKYKYKQDPDGWTDASVIYVGECSKFIRVLHPYDSFGYTVHECDYAKMIRIKESKPGVNVKEISECQDTRDDNKSDHNQIQEAETAPATSMDIDSNADGAVVPNVKRAAEKDADNSSIFSWRPWNKGSGEEQPKSPDKSSPKSPPKPRKKKRTWDQKAISDWSHKNVISWINSLASSEKYCPGNFPEYMDGKELLQTAADDFEIFIKKKMWRRRFIDQLDKAKEEYKEAKKVDENEYENDNDDKKEKEKHDIEVNGVVGLKNQGQTCYMNTSIQILSQSPYITRYLCTRAKAMKSKRGHDPNLKMLNAWTNLCDTIYHKPRPARYRWNKYEKVTPSEIRSVLERIDPVFGSGEQDDSSRSLRYILQALDEDIDESIKKGKKTNVVYKQSIKIYDGRQLNENEKMKYTKELRNQHNPCNSIVRKTFDGIEHHIVECLDCNKTFQQFATFRIIDLAVVSNEIKLENINIVCNDKYYHIPEISVLNYCSVDILRYHALQYLLQYKECEQIGDNYYDANIVFITKNGAIKDVNSKKISDIIRMNGAVFVLINTERGSSSESGRVLQIDLAINKNGTKYEMLSTKNGISLRYNKYDASQVHKLAKAQIEARAQLEKEGDEKFDYYINYNGNIFSKKELKAERFKDVHHKIEGINVLTLLKVNQMTQKYNYDINDIDWEQLWDADAFCKTSTVLESLRKYKSTKNKVKQNHSKDVEYGSVKDKIELKLRALDATIHVFKTKQEILEVTNKFINLSDNFIISSSTPTELRDLTECLKEYEKSIILDESSYPHPCPHCKSGSNSQWVKCQKKIVYSPPIFLFHLDRYGKDMNDNVSQPRSYHIGQKISVKWDGDGQHYRAKVISVTSKGIRIRYDDNDEEDIAASDYGYKIWLHNSSKKNTYKYGSNKFDHSIRYKDKLNWQGIGGENEYNLYGVSNHSGSTSGGHYTATVKCQTDEQWYDISDSNVNTGSVNPLSRSSSATILAYFRDQD